MLERHPHELKPITLNECYRACLHIIKAKNRTPLAGVRLTIGKGDILALDADDTVIEYEVQNNRNSIIYDGTKRDKQAGPEKLAMYAGVIAPPKNALLPKLFYYVVPAGVVQPIELPKFCGVITVYRARSGEVKYKHMRSAEKIPGHRPLTREELLWAIREVGERVELPRGSRFA